MSLSVTFRTVGSVTIVDMAGRVTLGEGASSLRNTLWDLVAKGRNKIVLNYSDISYQDSSGNGELVSGFTTVTNHGGYLVLLNLTKRLRDLMQITKLYTVFDVFDNEAAAVRFLETASKHWTCPLCYHRSSPQPAETASREDQTCTNTNCGARFSLIRPVEAEQEGYIERVRLSTYPDESFEIVSGDPFRLRIVGRLNLFTSSRLEQLWRALVWNVWTLLVDLRSVTEMSAEGQAELVRLLSAYKNVFQGAAISLEGLRQECNCRFPSTAPVYPDDASAIAALRLPRRNTPNWRAGTTWFTPDVPLPRFSKESGD
jgi:anti-sigma B factor antagonist